MAPQLNPQSSKLSPPHAPRVSVLMPTFGHAPFIRRALASLLAQTLSDWELVVVDDGSPDGTGALVAPYLADPRVRYRRLERNQGLGAALNAATELARGRYLAYLPSDDLYYPEHLALLADLLDERPDAYLAYGGVRHSYQKLGAAPDTRHAPLPAGADPAHHARMVQVMHRRDHEPGARWPERAEVVSDTLEQDRWRALLDGRAAAYAGAVTCEWVDHPHQRHKVIADTHGGVALYRRTYGVGPDTWLNFQPSRGMAVDERARYGRFAARRDLPAPGGLRILLLGSLGFNPERVVALEERGHKLLGTWIDTPETWDGAGPFPWGNIEEIPRDRRWAERVRAARPDVIYALLNWHALPLIDAALEADLGAPLVFHFKEGPFICQEKGLWPTLLRALERSDGRIFINRESLDWFQLATDGALDPDTTMVLDGDLPKADWMTDDWAPKLSALDGQIHTVCPGRPLGLDPFEGLAAAGIHVHFYGRHFHQWFPNWTRAGLATGHMHLHDAVDPADWVRELSRYDAAWLHLFRSANGGDLRRAMWDDLNLPARIGTFAAAGLPWIMQDNAGHRVGAQALGERLGAALPFDDFEDLAAKLRDRPRLERLTASARATRRELAFDTHADELVAFFRRFVR